LKHRRESTGRVAAAGPLNQDHIRAEVGQQHAREWAGQLLGQR